MIYNDYLKFLVKTNLMFIECIDKDMQKEYKKAVWLMMNEIEKPIMKSLFMNGRTWRTIKQEFLTVEK
jgi:hypothetical protein